MKLSKMCSFAASDKIPATGYNSCATSAALMRARKLLCRCSCALIALSLTGALFAQTPPPSTYAPQLVTFNGVPFGPCDVYQVALNVSNGVFYTCAPLTRVWVLAASGLISTTNNWTGLNSFSQPITSTVATGTAPFSIASTTIVPNLNAQLHNGLTAPGSAIVGISDTQTLTNKTLTSASNGNSVTLLCSSGPAAAITGNSSPQNIFSCTIPANVVANLKGMRVTATWSHSTGTAAVTYGMTLNGVACWPSNNSAATVGGLSQIANFIETGSTTGNVMTQQGFFSFTTTSLTGLSWTAGQTLSVTFNVASTDAVTPLFFLVELIQ